MIIISGICLIQTQPPSYKIVNLAGKILCYVQKPTYKSVRNQLSSVVNFRDRNTVDFAIRIIDRENNEISVVFKELKGFEHIPDNILFSNRLSIEPEFVAGLPSSIGYLTHLNYLHIDCLGLTTLPIEIGKLVNLEYLNISYNKLTDLPMSMKKLKKLRTLYMNHNPFPEIPRVIMKIIYLKQLLIYRHNEYRTWRYSDSIKMLKHRIPNLKIFGC